MTPNPSGINSEDRTGDDSGPQRRGPTRRQAIVLAGGTAAVFGASVGPFAHLFTAAAADGDQEVSPDIALATWLIGLELGAAELYSHVRDASAFDDAAKTLAETCGTHHSAQAAALGEIVAAGGGDTPNEANDAFLSEYRPRLDGAQGGDATANFFVELENKFAATYEASLETLTSSALAALAAKILATDAAQAVAWSAVSESPGNEGPLPSEDVIPSSQTDAGQFDQDRLQPTPPKEDDDSSDSSDDASDTASSTGEES